MVFKPFGVMQAIELPITLDQLIEQPETGLIIESKSDFKDGLLNIRMRAYKLGSVSIFANYITTPNGDSYGNPRFGPTTATIFCDNKKIIDYLKECLKIMNYQEK